VDIVEKLYEFVVSEYKALIFRCRNRKWEHGNWLYVTSFFLAWGCWTQWCPYLLRKDVWFSDACFLSIPEPQHTLSLLSRDPTKKNGSGTQIHNAQWCVVRYSVIMHSLLLQILCQNRKGALWKYYIVPVEESTGSIQIPCLLQYYKEEIDALDRMQFQLEKRGVKKCPKSRIFLCIRFCTHIVSPSSL